MIRNNIYTNYRNKEYRIAKIEGNYELISNDKNDLSYGFFQRTKPKSLIINGIEYEYGGGFDDVYIL